jgi:hypothetical protein
MLNKPSTKRKMSKQSLKTSKTHLRTQSTETLSSNNLSQKRKKKSHQKNHKRTASTALFNLKPLVGKKLIKVPKIFENQIFSDIYDEKGNHDRILEVSDDVHKETNKYFEEFIDPELLLLPTAGRNICNSKKILFYA